MTFLPKLLPILTISKTHQKNQMMNPLLMSAIANYFSEKALPQAEEILKQKFKLDFLLLHLKMNFFYSISTLTKAKLLTARTSFSAAGFRIIDSEPCYNKFLLYYKLSLVSTPQILG